ncbi:MAG: glycosyltransferase, partial [Eubacterium sp.]|nr:glycosyltransferase [Eubacterium sp.]
MKVALFTETYLPAINGVVTHVKTLKEGLEGLGHKVIIVTANAEVKRHEMSGDMLYCPAIKLKKIYDYDVASPLSAKRLKILRDFSPDIIHIHNEFGVGISGIFIAKILRIPLVYTLHTMYDDYVYYVANRHFQKFVTRATHQYARGLAIAADAITGPSRKVEAYFKNCGV